MTELPTETELISGEWYTVPGSPEYTGVYRASDGWMSCIGFEVNPAVVKLRWQRLGRVAEYRPAPAEPTGLGAVVKDAKGHVWVRIPKSIKPWRYSHNAGFEWKQIDQPVTVLSEGVTE